MPDLHIGQDSAGEPVTLDTDAKRYQAEGIRIGLFASPGAGKGYLLGVLLEEFIAAGYPVVMVDAESELWTFREAGALVLGGPHGHAPLDPTAHAAIEAALSFAFETSTPLVFDLHGRSPNEQRAAFEAIATPYWSLIEHLRQPAVLAITEAHLIAPEKLPRGASFDAELLPRIQSGGRKRGAITIVETQRIAEIANAVIGHCNVRAVGRVDFEDDFRRVKQGLPRDVDFAVVSALEAGQFYMPRISPGVVHVRERRVTHGGGTPTSGPVRLRKDTTPKALAGMAERLAALMQPATPPGIPASPTAEKAASSDGASPAPPTSTPQARRRSGRREAPLEQRSDAPAVGPVVDAHRLEQTRAERDDARRELREVREHLTRQLALVTENRDALMHAEQRQRERADHLEEQLHAWHTLRDVLATALGSNGSTPSPATGEGRGEGSHGLTEDRVLALIRQHGGEATARPALRPVEALRAGYLERAAERLVERVRALDADAREVLLFLLAHPAQQTTTSISKGLTGQTGGAGFQRISTALLHVRGAGLVEQYKSGNNRPWRPVVEDLAKRELSAHNPTDQELADVVERALSVVLAEDA